ncbi:MAG: hypothetical protein ACRD2R_05370 [Terriglobales bacterium]
MVQGGGGRWQACPLCNGNGVKQQQVLRVPFWYVFANVVLAALGATPGILQTDQDADFEWIWVMTSQTGLFNVVPVDTATGRRLSNNPINGENWSGTAQLPFPLVEPYLLARSSSLQLNFVDRSGAPNTIQAVLGGYKLFPVAAPMQGSQGAIVQA